jgi:hypothetical protein
MPRTDDEGTAGLECRIAVLVDEIKRQLQRIERDHGLVEMTPVEERPAVTLRAGCSSEARLTRCSSIQISVEVGGAKPAGRAVTNRN